MENRINQVLELENGKKYVVFKQAVYKGNNYYVSVRLTDDENDLTDDFVIFEEVEENGKKAVLQVTDPKIFSLVAKYVGLLDNKIVEQN